MVGMGLIMLGISWFGNFLRWRGRLETTRWFLWATFLSFPTGFVAVLCGWFTAEVGRQPWVVYGLLRTKDAVTPSLATGDVVFSLLAYMRGVRGDLLVRILFHLSAVARRAGRSNGRAGATSTLAAACRPSQCTGTPGRENDRHGTLRSGAVLGRRHRRRHRSYM